MITHIKKTAVYISGPMSNVPEFNYPKFYAVQDHLEEAGFRVFNPAQIASELTPVEKETVGSILNLREAIQRQDDREWLTLIVHDLPYVFRSDMILMLDGWEESPGAAIEYAVALRLGIKIVYERDLAKLDIKDVE